MLKLSVRVGDSIAIGGPTTMRVEAKSGQEVALVFDAHRSIPIRLIPETAGAAKPLNAPVGLGSATNNTSPGLGRNSRPQDAGGE